MKKGFTLIEMVGVMVILGLIVAFTFPVIIDVVKDKKAETNELEFTMIKNAAQLYIKDNSLQNQNMCINISTLQRGKYLKEVNTEKEGISVTYSGGDATYELVDSCS